MSSPNFAEIRRFNPRLPGGRRLAPTLGALSSYSVSIHAFRGEGDPSHRATHQRVPKFQSTPSGGKATRRPAELRDVSVVSIHAFRGEGDAFTFLSGALRRSFNPRLPGGRRLVKQVSVLASVEFQSTPSGGKATTLPHPAPVVKRVSIHAFRGEGDFAGSERSGTGTVSIHAFRGEGDVEDELFVDDFPTFQSTPSGGEGDCALSGSISGLRAFQSTPSGGEGDSIIK